MIYFKASAGMMQIFDLEIGTAENDESELLLLVIKNYNNKYYQSPELNAFAVIKLKMKESGTKAKESKSNFDRKSNISAILSVNR